MTDRGWFALYRGTLDHPVFADEPFTEREAWIWMLDEAAYQARKKLVAGRMIPLARGQLVASLRFMQERWGWASLGRVDRFLNRLKNENMIGTDNGTGVTIITICNYDALQPSTQENGTATGHKTEQQRDGDGTATEQIQRKEIREEGNNKESPSLRSGDSAQAELIPPVANLPATTGISPSRKTGKRPAREESAWPDGFELDGDLHRYAEDAGIPFQEIPALWERFKNHHQAKGTRFKDWRAAWRTWVGNEIKFSRGRANAAGRPERAAYDPIEVARRQIAQFTKLEEEDGTLWPKTAN